MSSLSLVPAPDEGRRFRNGLLFALVAALFGLVLGAASFTSRPEVGGAVGAGGLFIMAATLVALADWRAGLALLVVAMLGEDSLRKGLPGAPAWVNLGKDFVLAACYVSFLFNSRLRGRWLPEQGQAGFLVLVPVALWSLFVLAQCFNPDVPHWLIAVSGLRTWVLCMPMLVLMGQVFRTPEQARDVLNRIALLAVPFLLVALLQNTFGDALPAFLKEGTFGRERVLETGDWVGYNESVFANPTLYALVCLFQFCLVIGLLKQPQTPRWTALLWVSGYCAIAGAYISGVRTGLTMCVIAALALSPLILARHVALPGGRLERRRGLFKGGLAGVGVGALLFLAMSPLRKAALLTAFDNETTAERVSYAALTAPLLFGGGAWGHGTGTAGASGRVMTLLGQPPYQLDVAEWGTSVVGYMFGEAGLWLGSVLGLWLLFGLFSFAIKLPQARHMPLRLALWVYLVAQLAWYLLKAFPVLENGSMSLLFWSGAGLILGLYRLDSREQAVLPLRPLWP